MLPADLFSAIAINLPLEQRAAFNLSTHSWMNTLTGQQLSLLTTLELKPHALLFRRLANFIAQINQQLTRSDYVLFSCDRILREMTNLINYPSLRVLLAGSGFLSSNKPILIFISRLQNSSYTIRMVLDSNMEDTSEINWQCADYIAEHDFPFVLLTMVVCWKLVLTGMESDIFDNLCNSCAKHM